MSYAMLLSSKTPQRLKPFLLTQTLHTKPTSLPNPTPPNPPPILDHATVHETLSSYSNDWKKALDFFTWVETQPFQHQTETYNKLIDILGKYFEFDHCWALLHKMKLHPSSLPNHTTFRVIFKRYVTAHLIKEAIDTYNKLGEFGLKDETSFCNLVDALCEHKHVIEAQELLSWKKNDEVFGFDNRSVKLHNMILRGWAKMGWWGKCRDFWEEMDRRGVCKDLHSYSVYMDIMCKSGKAWKAVKLYKEMKKKRIKLDVIAYNIVIRAIGVSEGVDFAVRILREMKELGCDPNVATYNTIIKLLCENMKVGDAFSMFGIMSKNNCRPDVITYQILFKFMEKPNEILRLLDRMIENGVQPRMDTYVMIMRKFGRWGFLRPMFIVWRKMESLGCSPNESAYNALIDALIDKGMIDMARKYDEEMIEKGLPTRPRVKLGTKLVE